MVELNEVRIAVVLNAFKRTEYLSLQLDAIENQSIKPVEVYLWHNRGQSINESLKSRVILAECSENLGVWSRFAYALNADVDYICVLDDDTIPGARWFENCVKTMETHDGLLGTRGLQYLSKKRYNPYKEYGWANPNEETVQVDIVGHAWFFRREHLAQFWSELPPKEFSRTSGEDIHFSYMLQKAGINTYVPPHPTNETELWGSLPEYGKNIGTNDAAISLSSGALSKFDKAYRYYISRGFELCLSRKERLSEGVVLGSGVKKNPILRKIVDSSPLVKKIAKKVHNLLAKIGFHV
ncbi:glycosyltransferase [Corallincola spongiicola]|uniref:Glycosyltransferase n=1 Tax=Corallincola spongiicola TaxID=2520508 RepID=A0ABY1WKB5_9GAMM|nr:glycosyltransferase [Corallincola spongiicola]TAA39591.1 glycosyltransferase [Corallincola spongiicola]